MRKRYKFELVIVIALGLTCLPAFLTHAACPDGITSYWKLDESAGPTYEDFIGVNGGTGNASPTAAGGTIGWAQLFAPGDGTGIDVPAARSFNWHGSDDFSIEYWVNVAPSVSAGNHVALGRFEDTGAAHDGVFWFAAIDGDSGIANAIMEDTNDVSINLTGITDLRDSVWHHIVVVHDTSLGATGTLLLYVDGAVEDSQEVDYTGGFLSNSAALTIGWFDFAGNFRFDGLLDELALYDRALPQAEIQDHHTAGVAGEDYCEGSAAPSTNAAPYPDGTISLWSLDESAGPDYLDSVDGNDGTGNASPAAAGGVVGGAQLFAPGDGTGIDVPAARSFDWLGSDDFSIEYWVNVDPGVSAGNHVALGRFEDTGAAHDGVFWFAAIDGDSGIANAIMEDTNDVSINLTGITDLRDSAWHHIVVVHDNSLGAAGTILLYVDGVVEDSQEVDYTGGFLSNSAALNIGWFDFGGNFRFDGLLDEVALYDRALPQAEIQNHHTVGLAGTGIDEAQPAPVAVAAADQTTVKELTEVTLDGTGSSDGDNNIAAYLWEQTAGTPTVAINNADMATATFTPPDVAANTTLTFQLTVTDDDGQSDTDTLQVNVVNRITPTANPGSNLNVNEGDTVNLDGSGSSDADGTIAAYAWTQTGGTSATLTGANTATPSFTAPDVPAGGETLMFELTVTDNEGLTSAPDTVSVTVNDFATPGVNPTAFAGDNQTVSEGGTVNLDGSASSDSDGTIQTFAWAQTAGTTVTLAGADTATPSFTAPEVDAAGETLAFELTVTDNDGLTSVDVVNIVVAYIAIDPVAVAGDDQNVREGTPVNLDGSASSDSDGTIQTFAWAQTAGTTVSLTGADTASPGFTAPEVHTAGETLTFELTVTDNDGLTSTDTVNVMVNDVTVPIADAGPDQEVRESSPVTLDGSNSSDEDGTIDSYLWEQQAGSAVTLTGADTATASFTAPFVGSSGETLTFRLTVTDNDGNSSSDTVDVTVLNTNHSSHNGCFISTVF